MGEENKKLKLEETTIFIEGKKNGVDDRTSPHECTECQLGVEYLVQVEEQAWIE